MHRTLLLYLTLLLTFGGGIFATLKVGTALNSGRADAAGHADRQSPGDPHAAEWARPAHTAAAPAGAGHVTVKGSRDPLAVLLLQMLVILVVAKGVAWVLGAMHQPAVIGEMVAGILLGSSFLGVISPSVMEFLFPPSSLDTLKLLSQVGVIIFMFIVGMELDLGHLREKANAAVLVSHVSILLPLFLGTLFSIFVYDYAAPAGISFNGFALFMGVAMSITAFPVLARILKERGLSKSPLGATAIACAALDDSTAWFLLAVVVALVKAEGLGGAGLTVVAALLFSGLVLFLCRPYAARLLGEVRATTQEKFVWVAVTLLLISALITERIGIHALFGAFLAGVAIPSRAGLRTFLTERLGSLTSALLLPLFFAFTGLRTQINLLDSRSDWIMCVGVVAVAIAGKLGGSMLAARWTGMGWRESAALGVLMNTRGLMELVVLNIGYDLGILSPRVFSVMIIMALVTTFMTSPMLSALAVGKRKPEFAV